MRVKLWHGILMIVCMSSLAYAQGSDVDRFFSDTDQEAARFGSIEDEMRREMDAFYAESAQEIQSFKDERDRDFAEFLKEKWQAFDEFEGLVKDPTPKPVKFPKAAKKPDDVIAPLGQTVPPPSTPVLPPPPVVVLPQPEPPVAVVPSQPEPEPPVIVVPSQPEPEPPVIVVPSQPEPEPPVIVVPSQPEPEPPVIVVPSQPEPPTDVPQPATIEVAYLGRTLRVVCDRSLAVTTGAKITNREISAYWEKISTADFEPMLSSLLTVKEALQLNDWGYFQFVQEAGEALHGPGNDAQLFAWFALTKSGYRVRVGYSDNRVFLLAPIDSLVYQAPYYTLDGTRYYNISYFRDQRKPGKVYTYSKDYPRAERLLSLKLPLVPRVGEGHEVRSLHFLYQNKEFTVPVSYNRNALVFYNSYPQTDWAIYFAAPLATEAEQSLIDGLGKLVAGKSETEAVNMLLRFAQTAFEYQTDDEQFGREKYMFAEETVAFRYSDCEDRSILFSYLVTRIVGLDVVGVHFPGHIATAVNFTEKVEGDAILVDGKRFVVCDPTYINANIGMMMPQFKAVNPEIIRFKI
ncbi:MAG: hypothetical protein P1P74_01585 [Desulfuromonadales bacterium]|nr:hypothetical protein [Desulfuromonadales bacterium]